MKDGRAGSPMGSEGEYAEEGKPSRRRRRRRERDGALGLDFLLLLACGGLFFLSALGRDDRCETRMRWDRKPS